jgi:hypothetical protein
MKQGGPEQGGSDAASLDTRVRAIAAERPPPEAALALAELSTRVATELHKLARAQAAARRGEADWGSWAKLANAARTAVLQAAACRDAARGLAESD